MVSNAAPGDLYYTDFLRSAVHHRNLTRRNQDRVSMNFERWKQLAALASKEQDPARLTDLARELNLVLTEKTQTLDSLARKPPE